MSIMQNENNNYKWVEMELKDLGHPTSQKVIQDALYGMYDPELCEYLGANYSRMNFDDRRKIYFHVIQQKY